MAGRFQFSICFLLAVTTAVAAAVAAVRAEHSIASSLAIDCLSVIFATSAIVGVVQTAGRLRAFWIGNAILLGPAAVVAVMAVVFTWPSIRIWRHGDLYDTHAAYSYVWPVWCAAPVNGFFAVFLHWLFSPRRDAVRFPVAALIALLLVLPVATFFGGIWFGELRESDRHNREEQEAQDVMDEEMENPDE